MNRWVIRRARLVALASRLLARASEPRNAFAIALILPIVFVSVAVEGQPQALVVLVIYLFEAIGYAAWRRERAGVTSGPNPLLQASSGCLAAVLILAGLFVAGSSTGLSVALGWALVIIGVATIVWIGRRVARASNDSLGGLVATEGSILWRTVPALLFSIVVAIILAGVAECTNNGS